MTRIVAMATRCQLLTGSYAGVSFACPCKGPADCQLTKLERGSLCNHPAVVAARERNRAEFASLPKEGEWDAPVVVQGEQS